MTILIFDIEAFTEVKIVRKIFNLDEIDDREVGEALVARQYKKTEKTGFLPLYSHRICTISVASQSENNFKNWSLEDDKSSEKELLERFFQIIERRIPRLVSLNYYNRAEFRYNNYLNRYHLRNWLDRFPVWLSALCKIASH